MFDFAKPDWAVEGKNWPLRDWSRFCDAGGMRWHVQTGGAGPVCLLLHGTGASTHSWRGLAPLLAAHFTVVAPDLPGHGFTATPRGVGLSLGVMARLVGRLVAHLEVEPALVVGHSAGAAIGLRMAIDRSIVPAGIVGLNAALRPYRGAAGPLFSMMAKALFVNPLAPRIFSASARDPRRVAKLLASTGSPLDAEGVAYYQRLLTCPGHVAGALSMMAGWDLAGLQDDFPRLKPEVLLVATVGDRAVPPAGAFEAARRIPDARVVTLPRLGHLAHEEDARAIASVIERFAGEIGVRVPEAASA
ncbi:alpha/beta fold hydrolase BchO [Acuticoccus kandeliae]|uniref:alpha/beta fold hydrolase BchO n=1 Tax=Acuticoccus kandeliae TaxID=2073160 RepID=UPI000D3E1D20|nr:alpha/beta fold hydrolase BchO [Acuticoccus kandeliae]